MEKIKKIFSIVLIGIILTGCAKLSEGKPREIGLIKIYTITNNQIDSNKLRIVEDEKTIEKVLEEQNLYNSDLSDGCRWVICQNAKDNEKDKINEQWMINICTQENEQFVYRNINYKIPVYEGNDYILYQIPGGCSDYMIFVYSEVN